MHDRLSSSRYCSDCKNNHRAETCNDYDTAIFLGSREAVSEPPSCASRRVTVKKNKSSCRLLCVSSKAASANRTAALCVPRQQPTVGPAAALSLDTNGQQDKHPNQKPLEIQRMHGTATSPTIRKKQPLRGLEENCCFNNNPIPPRRQRRRTETVCWRFERNDGYLERKGHPLQRAFRSPTCSSFERNGPTTVTNYCNHSRTTTLRPEGSGYRIGQPPCAPPQKATDTKTRTSFKSTSNITVLRQEKKKKKKKMQRKKTTAFTFATDGEIIKKAIIHLEGSHSY